MVDKVDGKKTGKLKGTAGTGGVDDSQDVSGVGKASATGKVSKVGATGSDGVRRPTRTMTLAEREELFSIINEEAQKIFKNSDLPDEQREVVVRAVEMAVDSALIDGGDDEDEKAKKKKKSS